MQYFFNLPNAVSSTSSSDPGKIASTPAVELRSSNEPAADLMVSQRAAISKAYGDLLIGGRHVGC
jgi:hypothetical protein